MNAILLTVLICAVVVDVTQNTPINSHARETLGGVSYEPPVTQRPFTPLPPLPTPPPTQLPIQPLVPPHQPLIPSLGGSVSSSALSKIDIQTKDFTHYQETIGSQEDGVAVKGEYSFIANGINSNVVYIADSNGYRAKILYKT